MRPSLSRSPRRWLLASASAGLMVATAPAAELTVGTGKNYLLPSQAAAACQDGDTISIDAGLYNGDVCTWNKNNLVIHGVGGKAHIKGTSNHTAGGKALWVVAGNNNTFDQIEWSDAAIDGDGSNGSANAAGIRFEGSGMSIRNCYFHDNQNGILGNAGASSDILIEYCEFAHNGAGDGYTHNLYIGAVRTLTFRYNYSHHAHVGHNLKTRALTNYILNNRIMDESTGDSSYVVDVPNGGLTFLIGNLIQQGPASSNHGFIVRYAEEGASNPLQRLYAINNTVVNDYTGTASFLDIPATTTTSVVSNNLFIGPGTAITGSTPTLAQNNLQTTADLLVNRTAFDYHLASGTNAAVDSGTNPGTGDGYALLPTRQYLHPYNSEVRAIVGGQVDIGAYERGSVSGNTAPTVSAASATPATVTGTSTALSVTANDDAGEASLTYTWSVSGPSSVGFSANGSNNAKTATATFTHAGTHTFTATVSDGGGLTATTPVTVTVVATATSLAVTPATSAVTVGSSQAFSATVSDQFASALLVQPGVTWTVDGGGSIDTQGNFTAGNVAGGTHTVTATAGAIHGSAMVTVDSAPVTTGTGSTPGADSSSGGCGTGGLAALLVGAFTALGLRSHRKNSLPDVAKDRARRDIQL